MSLVPYLHRVAGGADLTSSEAHAAMMQEGAYGKIVLVVGE